MGKNDDDIELLSDEKILEGFADESPLGLYLRQICAYPLLTPEEEKELAVLIKNGDDNAKRKFINSNLRLVVSIARKYSYGEYILDAIQNGNIGLLKAVEKFDVTKGYRFSTYATYWIRQAITREKINSGDTIRIPVNVYELSKKYVQLIDQFKGKHGRNPSDSEVIEILGISSRTLTTLKNLHELNPVSLNEKVGDDEDIELQNLIATDKEPYANSEKSLDEKILLFSIKEILDEFEYYIVYNRIFKSPPHTLEELAQDFGITRERIRQIERKALEKIRKKRYDSNEDGLGKEIFASSRKEIAYIKKQDAGVRSFDKTVKLYYIKEVLDELEYYIIYSLYFSNSKHSIVELGAVLDISIDRIKEIKNQALEKIKSILSRKDLKEQLLSKYNRKVNQIMRLDFTPTLIASNVKNISEYFSTYSYEDIENLGGDYIASLNSKQIRLIKLYFNAATTKIEGRTVESAEREVNLKILGYSNAQRYSPRSELYKSYINNIDLFNQRQRACIDYAIFKTIPKSEFKKLYGDYTEEQLKTHIEYLYSKLEKVHFGLYSFFNNIVSKDMIEKVLQDKTFIFEDIQRKTLELHYGIGKNTPHNIKQIADLLGVSYVIAHDKLASSRERVLKLYLGKTKMNVEKDASKYKEYIKNVQYELTSETRKILNDHLLKKKTYDEISKETGLSRRRISDIVTEGIRKMEFYRHKVMMPLIVTREDLKGFYQVNDKHFNKIKKDWIRRRYFLGQTSEDISKEVGANRADINRVFARFTTQFLKYKCNVAPTIQDYKNEILCTPTHSVLDKFEREFASYYYGIKSRYNTEGIKCSKEQLKEKYSFNEDKYHKVVGNFTFKVRQRVAGLLLPEYGLISREELIKVLKDPRLPISDKEREILKHLKGIDGYRCLSDKSLSKKYNMTAVSLKRRYQRAVLSIRQYQNGEIDPVYSYDLDIDPVKKYFCAFDQKLLIRIYRDLTPEYKLHKEFNVSQDVMRAHINRIKTNLLAILKKDKLAKKFDFDCAREVIDNPDLPLYENREQLVQLYKTVFGEEDKNKIPVQRAIEQLNLPHSKSAVLEAIYLTMIAIEKYKSGIRRNDYFSYEQVQDYYNKYKDSINNTKREKFEAFFRRTKENYPLNRRSSFFTDTINYELLKEYSDLPFKLSETSAEDSIKLLNRYSFSNSTKNTIYEYYGIQNTSELNGRDKNKVLKLLYPIYRKQVEERQSALSKAIS